MSAAFDAQSSASDATGATSKSWTHTPVGTPSGVVVFAQYEAGTITGVTYGGVTLTLVGNQGLLYAFKSTATPPSGAQTVVVTASGVSTTAVPIFGGAVTVTGGDTASPVRTFAGASPSALGGSATITVPSGDLGVAAAAGPKQGDTLLKNDGAANTWSLIAGTDRNFSGSQVAGSVASMGFTSTFSTQGFDILAVSMAAASAGGGSTGARRLLMGMF